MRSLLTNETLLLSILEMLSLLISLIDITEPTLVSSTRQKNSNTKHTSQSIVSLIDKGKCTKSFGFYDSFLFSLLVIIITVTILCIQLLSNFQNTLGQNQGKLTVVSNVCRILTTEILERHVYPFTLFNPDAVNYQILLRKKEMVTTLFTNNFHSLKND